MARAGSRPKSEKPSSALGKFTRPRPVGALPRLRLFSALDAARDHQAVWIAAPPGAGKTTLASTYVAQRRLRTIWYRVHEEDVDPATFFHYFGMAVDAVAPRKGRAALPHLTPEYLLNLPAFSRRYFEQVYQRVKAPALLLLDNYQDVPREAALHEVMRQAIESLPPGMNVMVLSRAEPPPALAALRANGTIAVVGGEELRLSSDECLELARLRKARLDAADLDALYKRTLGWTAGVVLALEQKGSPAGESGSPMTEAPPVETTPQLLFDYFGGEIFDRMPRESQLVLLQAAFLPSMAGRRVAELTGAPAAESLLESLTRSNYFTLRLARPHPAPAVYQFHPLFREFLLKRAQETLPAPVLVELRRKAAVLLEADGETADAMALLIAAQAWDEAIPLMLLHAREMLEQGRGRVLEEWLRALPVELRERTPWALYWLGMSRLAFDPLEARGHLERAFRLFESGRDVAGQFTAWASLIETFVYEWGDFAAVDRWIAVLDALLARQPRFPSAEVEARVTVGMFMALMYRQPQRPDLPQWAERMRSLVLGASDERAQMILGNQLVHYYNSWLGDLASTRLILEAVRRPANAADVNPLIHIAWRAMEAGYHWYMAEHEECLRAADDGLETARRIGARFMNTLLVSHGLIGRLTAGDFTTAARFLKDAAALMAGGRRLDRSHYHFLVFLDAYYRKDYLNALTSVRESVALADAAGVPYCEGLFRLGLAHALFACGQRGEAHKILALARRISRRTRVTNVEFGCLYTAIFFALERGKRRLALPLLRKMLESAKRHGYVNRLFWTPEIMSRTLGAALEHGVEVEFVQKLIRKRKLAPPAAGTDAAFTLEHWPLPVKVHTLGRFGVLIDGKPLQFKGKAQKKPLELLMALIAFGGRDVSEEKLAEALWPDAEGDAAHKAFGVAVLRLRRLLKCDEAISVQRTQVSLDPRFAWVDAWALERALAASPDAKGAAASERIIGLYRGPFLGRTADLPWAVQLRERLRVRFVRHIIQRAQALFDSGEAKPAIAVLEKGIAADPLAEDCYRHLMLCYQALDRKAEAIGVYQRCQKTLSATLGVSPAPETTALYRTLQR